MALKKHSCSIPWRETQDNIKSNESPSLERAGQHTAEQHQMMAHFGSLVAAGAAPGFRLAFNKD